MAGGYTPMPMILEQQLQSIIREVASPHASASNTVFIIREALGQAYAAGHKDGHTLAQSLNWITKDLDKAYQGRKDALKTAKAAPVPAAEADPA